MSSDINIIDQLLDEFKKSRDSIIKMIRDIEILYDKIGDIFPDKFDHRSRMFFQEKVKTITEFYKTILDMKKEIQKSIKDEIEIRRKIGNSDRNLDDIEESLDIRKILDTVENFKNKTKLVTKKIKKKSKNDENKVDLKDLDNIKF